MILGGLLIVAVLIYYFFIYRGIHNSNKNSLKKCPKCSSDIEDNFNICPICKVTLIKKCPNCGNRVEILWNFCPECEKRLEKDERK